MRHRQIVIGPAVGSGANGFGLFQQGLGLFIGRLQLPLLEQPLNQQPLVFKAGLAPFGDRAAARSRSATARARACGRFRSASSCSIFPARVADRFGDRRVRLEPLLPANRAGPAGWAVPAGSGGAPFGCP